MRKLIQPAIFIFSLLSTYFVLYRVIIDSFYHIQLGGGDWGFLAILVGWPMYIVSSAPAFAFVVASFTKYEKILNQKYTVLAALPLIIGFVLLVILTFSGRLLFEPIYAFKEEEIRTNIQAEFISIKYLGMFFDQQYCKCIRPTVEGTIKVRNNVSFPISFDLRLTREQAGCYPIQQIWELLPNTTTTIDFHCYINDFNGATYTVNDFSYKLHIEEIRNAGVQVDIPFENSNFSLRS